MPAVVMTSARSFMRPYLTVLNLGGGTAAASLQSRDRGSNSIAKVHDPDRRRPIAVRRHRKRHGPLQPRWPLDSGRVAHAQGQGAFRYRAGTGSRWNGALASGWGAYWDGTAINSLSYSDLYTP